MVRLGNMGCSLCAGPELLTRDPKRSGFRVQGLGPKLRVMWFHPVAPEWYALRRKVSNEAATHMIKPAKERCTSLCIPKP